LIGLTATGSDNPQVYWQVLKMQASDGKMRMMDVANESQLFRLSHRPDVQA
jgi:hypothetical protein